MSTEKLYENENELLSSLSNGNEEALKFIYQKYWQRLLYLHENPVRAGFVYEPEHWMYSSAIDYYNGVQKGLLEISFLE